MPRTTGSPRLDRLTSAQVRSFRRSLLRFFEGRRRDLPWRVTRDPYAVLVSEVMLQQTRVETVIPYFRAWMERFPTARSLADADTDDVLKAWEGMGYYSRARNLQSAVREVSTRYDGRIPGELEALRSLPGIGPYTAGAVASIAFGVAAPAVDGNARRVLSRLADDPFPSPIALERWAGRLVDPGDPGAFNQALMELGSLVCTPRNPSCAACPVARFCAARAAGTQGERPRARVKKKPPLVVEVVAILAKSGLARSGARVLLRKRPQEGLLAGMWELPTRTVGSTRLARNAALELARELMGATGTVRSVRSLPVLVHAFSHRRMRYLPFLMLLNRARGAEAPGLLWASRSQTDALAVPSAQRKLLSMVWTQLPEGAEAGIAQMGQIAISGSSP